ncbi:MAG: hypothetical protein HY319_14250 [Armatimonadetes bacterium]|nr:hypothetical protein [Armatimonadota bacterium]
MKIPTTQNRGLAAIPESWIPSGTSRAYVTSPFGSDTADTERARDRIDIDSDHAVSPDLRFTDLGRGMVELFVDMPFPLPNLRSRGLLAEEGEGLYFTESGGNRSADMYRLHDGTVVTDVHEPGKEDRRFTYLTI